MTVWPKLSAAEPPASEVRSKAVKDRLFLLLFCLPLFVGLGDSSIWDANEAFYVQTPREMVERGDWVVPYFNGEPRLNKPPLSYWLVGIAYQICGISVWAQRLVIALLGAASIWTLYRIGTLLFDSTAALWAAGILATSFRFVILSRRLLIDILTLSCVLGAILCFALWVKGRRRESFLGFCFLIGLGFLAKGPVALIPVLPLAAYLILSGQFKSLGKAPYIVGAILFGATACSWFFLLGINEGWKPVIDFFLKENLSRFSEGAFGPARGPFYYVGVFVVDFLPWSFLFPAAVFWTLKGRAAQRAEADEESAFGRPFLFLALWIAAYFVIFSLSKNKQEYYILPLYPAAALWIAAYFRQARPSVWTRLLAVIPALAAAAIFARLAWIVLSDETALWILPSLLLAAGAGLTAAGRLRSALAATALFYAAAFWVYLEPLERFKPVRPLARRIEAQSRSRGQPDYQAGYFRLTSPSLAFYLNRPVLELYSPEEAARRLESNDAVYLIMSADDYDMVEKISSRPLQIVERRPKLYTTARNLGRMLRSGRGDPAAWTRSVYLVSNR